jgi:hypothetical protein
MKSVKLFLAIVVLFICSGCEEFDYNAAGQMRQVFDDEIAPYSAAVYAEEFTQAQNSLTLPGALDIPKPITIYEDYHGGVYVTFKDSPSQDTTYRLAVLAYSGYAMSQMAYNINFKDGLLVVAFVDEDNIPLGTASAITDDLIQAAGDFRIDPISTVQEVFEVSWD